MDDVLLYESSFKSEGAVVENCGPAGRLYEPAWDIQWENWRRGVHWSERLDTLVSWLDLRMIPVAWAL